MIHLFNICLLLWVKKPYLWYLMSSSSSWTVWLIPAIAAVVVGVVYRYYMFEHKSSWVLASSFRVILFIWRPWNVWPNPPHTERTQLGACAPSATRKGGEQFDKVLLSLSVYVESTKWALWAETLLNCLPSVSLCFLSLCLLSFMFKLSLT